MTLPLPIQVWLYSKTTGGVPDFGTGSVIASVVQYEHSISDRFGFESLRLTLNDDCTLLDEDAALDWLDPENLMRPLRVVAGNDAHVVWQGVLTGVRVTISGKSFSIDLKDMANYLIVHYQVGNTGAQKKTSAVQEATSIASYGRKDRILSLDDTTDAGALQRARTGLAEVAYPQARESSEAAYDVRDVPDLYHRSVSVELFGMGVYGLLDWVTFTSSSTTIQNVETQVAALLTAYAGVNAYFDPTETAIISLGVAETEKTSEDTTYREKIEKLLALGTSAHTRVAWGFYDDGFHVDAGARANPTTIAYKEYTRTGLITDINDTPLAPWDLRPNKMALIADVTAATPATAAIDGPVRKYVSRVRCSVDEKAAKATLEPGNDDPLEALLAHPVGNGPVDTSERVSAITKAITQAQRPYATKTNGAIDLGGGSIGTGGGSIDTEGGSIGNTGGGNVDLGTGEGIGTGGGSGTTVAGSTGTADKLVKWGPLGKTLVDSSVTADGGGEILLSSADTLQVLLSGAAAGQVLAWNGRWEPTTTIPGILGSGTAGRVVAWDGDGMGLVDSELDVVGGGGILTIQHNADTFVYIDSQIGFFGNGHDLTLDGNLTTVGDGVTFTTDHGVNVTLGPGTAGQALVYDGTDWAPGTVGSIDGTGTAGRIAQWVDADTLTSATLIKSGAGVLTLSAGSAYTLTIASSGSLNLGGNTFQLIGNNAGFDVTGALVGDILQYQGLGLWGAVAPDGLLGSGTAGRLAQWASGGQVLEDSTLVKSGAGVLTLSAGSNATLTVSSAGTLAMAGYTLALGGDLSVTNTTTISGGGTLALAGNTLTLANGDTTLINTGGYLLTIPATGTAVLGTGTNGYMAAWSGTNTVKSSWKENLVLISVTDPPPASGGEVAYFVGGAGIDPSTMIWDGFAETLSVPVAYMINGTQVVKSRRLGWSAWTGTSGRGSKDTSTATLQDVAEAMKALLSDLALHGLIGP